MPGSHYGAQRPKPSGKGYARKSGSSKASGKKFNDDPEAKKRYSQDKAARLAAKGKGKSGFKLRRAAAAARSAAQRENYAAKHS